MSASHASALLAARPYGDRVHVVDTSTAAGGQGLAVLAAAEAVARGASLAEAECAARRVCDRVRLIAALRSFEQLARSGRVPEIAEWARKRLRVVPVFEFVDGKARPRRPALSWEAALDRIGDAVIGSARGARAHDGRGLHIAAMHASALDAAEQLLTPLRARFPAAQCYVGAFGTVMVAHTGTGLAGLAWYWDDDRAA
jgi:DegV family protein with EDD domain